ncbi:Uncharacterized protein APZ42_031658 [Daphnia magna]|uniref:DUF4371 domain-containing protein n=1 Tax=Daphnia magna TaxID=35525 RepID=A0A164MP29_9CRUS|nr:Uncharacterized protein APZ42_031658 [Daphnia magna]
MSQFDPFICNYLKEYGNKGKGRSSYLSSTIYEELITIMGVKVLSLIISEIQEARFFSVSIDSTPDLTHVDQLSMIIRYVSVTSHEATERLLSFIPIESHTGEYLANIILKFFENQKIDIKNVRGQPYDNAANMSGRYNDVKAKIIEKNPLAFNIPCTAHSLNLAGVCAAESCFETTRFFGIVQQLFSVFFLDQLIVGHC